MRKKEIIGLVLLVCGLIMALSSLWQSTIRFCIFFALTYVGLVIMIKENFLKKGRPVRFVTYLASLSALIILVFVLSLFTKASEKFGVTLEPPNIKINTGVSDDDVWGETKFTALRSFTLERVVYDILDRIYESPRSYPQIRRLNIIVEIMPTGIDDKISCGTIYLSAEDISEVRKYVTKLAFDEDPDWKLRINRWVENSPCSYLFKKK